MIRSALIAVAAAVAVLALSDATSSVGTGEAIAPLAKKADRIAASTGALAGDTGVMVNDPANRTTIVERGAVADLSAASPLAVVQK